MLSQKARYALKALFTLAARPAGETVMIAEIAEEARVPRKFLEQILPVNPGAMVRSSHEYIWDMLRWHGRTSDGEDAARTRELFRRDLFGIDEPLTRLVTGLR